MTDQINGENASGTTEGQNQNGFDLTPILDKLTMHGEVLAKLAGAPDTVNADGLRHLSDQTKSMVEAIKALPEQVQSKLTETVAAKETEALAYAKALELKLTRREIMQQYGFGLDDEKLFAPYTTADEIKEVAASLSERLKAAKPRGSTIEFANREEIKIAPQLQHLRSQ